MINKRTLVNLYKDIVLVTLVRIFCTTLFTNNNIKVVIQMLTFLMDQFSQYSIIMMLPKSFRLNDFEHSYQYLKTMKYIKKEIFNRKNPIGTVFKVSIFYILSLETFICVNPGELDLFSIYSTQSAKILLLSSKCEMIFGTL